MKKRDVYFLPLLLSFLLAAYGCGSQGSSSVETVNDGSMASSVMEGVTLMGSKQGQSGGFVDADGDGIDDKVVGAPYATTFSGTGAALVYKGNSDGSFSSSPDLLLTGDDNFGFSFANLGDVDGDGKSDFAVGAISGDGEDVSLSGSVYIYKGGSNGQIIKKLSGEGAMDKFGISIASGDLNNDGNKDVIVGAPFNTNDPSLYQQGAVYIFFGPDFTSKVSLYASSTNKGLGWAVASGYVNNDSVSDLLISSANKVLVFYGGTSFNPNINSPNVTINSYNAADKTSDTFKTIAVLGDLDGDGIGEIAAGAPNATVGGNRDTGTVVIVKGIATATVNVGTAQVPQTSTNLLVRINGTNLFDRFGSSITPLPDMDGDNKPELVVGATTANSDPYYLSGRVYLFTTTSLSGSSWAPSSAFDGNIKDQAYGTFLAPAPANIESLKGKLLIGAPRSNMDTGGVSMVDLATGEMVAGGSSGGGGGGGGECH